MFENQTNPATGNVPNNLPIGEPDDMFSGTPEAPAPAPSQLVVEPVASTPSAVDAGILRPVSVSPQPPVPPLTEGLRSEDSVMRDPLGGRKVLITLLTLVVMGIVGGAGAWIYFSFVAIDPTPITTTPNNTSPIVESDKSAPVTLPPTIPSSQPSAPTSTDERILFGEPVLDTDSDSLDDNTEKKIGTNMLVWDTDADTLSDGDEVLTWKTDPLKADTDGDTYTDGAEIKNGYNPKGTGKLFPVNPAPNSSSTPASAPAGKI